MKTRTLNNRNGAAVSNGKTVSRQSMNVKGSACGSVKSAVTDNGILGWVIVALFGRINDCATTRHRLTNRIVGFAPEFYMKSFILEYAKTLSRTSCKLQTDFSIEVVVRFCDSFFLYLCHSFFRYSRRHST